MKDFLTYNEQIILLRSKKLVKSFEKRRAKRILINENYYSLINGYKTPFLDANNNYVQNANFFELYALYKFDRELRNIIFKKILIIESKIKSILAHIFSKKYGNDYLNIENYDIILKSDPQYLKLTDKQKDKNNKKLGNVTALINTLTKSIYDNYAKKDFLNHYLLKHHQVPLWVLVNILTLGNISKFFSALKQPQKQQIAKDFNLTDNILEDYIKVLTLFRNICAHEERCYCINFKDQIKNTSHHQRLNIPLNKSGDYIMGKKDFFALLIVLKELLPKKDFKTLKLKLDKNIVELEKELKSISINDIYLKMGFPTSWKQL